MYRRLLVAAALALPLSATAQTLPITHSPAVASLALCLGDNTSGKDRKALARWIFFSMAAHPEITPYTNTQAKVDAEWADRSTAALFTRLLGEDCMAQTRAAYAEGGGPAIQAGFSALGQLAMHELMSNPDVTARMAGFEKHIDMEKLGKALQAPATVAE